MSTFLGNEILLSSDRLSYSFFESNWIDLSQSMKKNVNIFGELLMKPQEMVVSKLYPLTLQTLSRVRSNSSVYLFYALE